MAWGSWEEDAYYSEERNERLRAAGFDLISMREAFQWIEQAPLVNEAVIGLAMVQNRAKVLQSFSLKEEAYEDQWINRIEQFTAQLETRAGRGERLTVEEVQIVLPSNELSQLTPTLIDRLHKLLLPEQPGATPKGSVTPTLDDGGTVAVVSAALAEILELKEVDEGKSFQDYGLDSVSGVRLSMLLEKRLKLPVPPEWLVEFSSSRALSNRIAAAVALHEQK
jgi:acyl carrier protein